MNDITITADGDTIVVRSPYYPDWPAKARKLGGRYTGEGWTFDARDEERVRDLAREIYGTDGTPDPEGTMSVRIVVDDVGGPGDGQPAALYRFGRHIASRFSRDEEPRLGKGVVLIAGGFEPQAGSMKYPQLAPLEGTVAEVRDVPHAVARDNDLDIVAGSGSAPDRDALHAERDRLAARIAEIDDILG
uniref:hypothetical protein n=1 Tax=Amycolatopsis sp. CA-096443 TaxID=3239919 RepID=UPI003F493CAD